MAKFTEIEKEFRINIEAPGFEVAKGIEIAIAVEEKGRQFYSQASRKVSDAIKPFMKFLSEQELEHESMMEELKKSLLLKRTWISIQPVNIKKNMQNLSAFRKGPADESRESKQDIESLLTAMNMEKKTREFYLKLAKSIKGADGRAFFGALADWEKSHYELLSGIYNSVAYSRIET